MLSLIGLGLLSGLLAGVSPCVLPVLPVLFLSSSAPKTASGSHAGAKGAPTPKRDAPPAARNYRPYLIVAGLTLSFSVFTLLGTLIISALPIPDDSIRWAGLIV